MIKLKKNILLSTFTLIMSSLLLTGCSVVFTSSANGNISDYELYENGDSGAGISDAYVYLYLDKADQLTDLEAWQSDESFLPENRTDTEPLYFNKTVTDDQGDYTFNGLIWNDLFPKYGKSGDRKEVFLLFYHRNYGLAANPSPVYIVSDVTNRIPVITLNKIMNTAEITGVVTEAATGDYIANATVNIWVPLSWEYNSEGSVNTDEDSFTWAENPTYTSTTDDNGEWTREISYKMLPSSTDNAGTVIVRITYSAGGYIAENASDADITDGGWDVDANGVVDDDENIGYLQTAEISAGTYHDAGTTALADEYNTSDISGTVINSNTGEGEPNVTVEIFAAEEWTYSDSSDPESIIYADIVWPENPTYTVTTDDSGEYSQTVEFVRRPSETNNLETSCVRIVFTKNSFLIDNSTDSKLTDGGWDRDGNGTTESDESDAYYEPAYYDASAHTNYILHNEQSTDMGSIVIKQTEFSETLSGEVWNAAGTLQVNGVEVWLFFNPDAATLLTAAPADGDAPDYIDTTVNQVIDTNNYEKGHFSFDGLEWTDTAYTGNQSRASYYLYLPTSAEIEAGAYDIANSANLEKGYVTAGSSNYVSLKQ